MRLPLAAAALLAPALAPAQDPSPERRSDGRTIRLYELDGLWPATGENAPETREHVRRLRDLVHKAVRPRPDDAFLCEPLVVKGRPMLVVAATPSRQRWVSGLVERNRARKRAQIDLKVRVLHAGDTAWASVLKPIYDAGTKRPAVTVRGGVAVLRGDPRSQVERALAATKGAAVVTAPRLMVHPLRNATLLVGEEVSYIKDFHVEIANGSILADPVIDVIRDGTHLSCDAALLANGALLLDLDLTHTKLARPIKQFRTKIGLGAAVTVQLPEIEQTRVAGTLRLPEDGLAVLCDPRRDGSTPKIVVLIEGSVAAR